jgi:multidrug transporter EmrE-like cation transporter
MDPFVISGLVAAWVSAVFWMAAMTKLEISYAYPFVTAGLTAFMFLGGVLILGESTNSVKVLGLLIIAVGIIVMGLSR